jgi:hypothetical protein
MDLRSDDLALATMDEPDTAYACVVHLDEGGAASEVSPLWAPDTRYGLGEAPTGCPSGAPVVSYPMAGAREPDGDRVLLSHDGWRLLDLADGAETALSNDPVRGAGQGFWLDGGYAFAVTEGSDWGIPLVSTVTRTDDTGLPTDVVRSPGPFVALAALGHEAWVLSEPVARAYGDPEPPPTARVLWRLASTGASVPVSLPAGAAPVDLVSGGGYAWVLDEAGTVDVYDASGALRVTCPLVDGIGDGPRAASERGLFFLDGAGRPSVVTADCSVSLLSPDPVEWTIAGADDAWLYVAAEVGPGEGFTTTPALLALDPATLAVVGRIPTTRPPLVVPGPRLVVMDWSWILADRP